MLQFYYASDGRRMLEVMWIKTSILSNIERDKFASSNQPLPNKLLEVAERENSSSYNDSNYTINA